MTARFRLAFIFLFLAASCHAKEAPLEGAVATLAGQPVSVADLRETARFMGVGGSCGSSLYDMDSRLRQNGF